MKNNDFCAPYSFLNGRVIMAIMYEREIAGISIDGEPSMPTLENIKAAAKLVNPDYDLYKGWSDVHIILDADYDILDCRECPWKEFCDAAGAEEDDD